MAQDFGAAAGLSEIKSLNRNCNSCKIELTTDNGCKVYKKGKDTYRGICKKCRHKEITKSYVGNPKRQAYIRAYIRKVGIVQEYPCETCQKPCYKKHERAFCSDICRFMAYVDKQKSCWIWTGAKDKKGYGQLCFGDKKKMIASRVSYQLFIGPIENGLLVCHQCDTPSCVNPKHLFLGTHQENMIDMTEKGRQYSKLTPKDVLNLRSLWEKGYSNSKLCEMFNLTSGCVSNIVHRRNWKHV